VLQVCSVDTEFLFMFVLRGTVSLHGDGRPEGLAAGDCFVVPAGMRHGLAECSGDLELLEVSLPAAFETVLHPDAVPGI
jgi:mannose-6-phosphate isomerase-like protein (cupin superfamily)